MPRVPIRRDADLGSGQPLTSFRGGMRHGVTGLGNFTYPFATLDIHPTGIEIRATYRWMRPLFKVWRARYDEIAAVQSIGYDDSDPENTLPITAGRGFPIRGVRFVAKDGSYIIFWCFNRDEVLAVLDHHQAVVEHDPKPFRWLHPDSR